MVKTVFPMQGVWAGLIPGEGTKIPCAVQCNQKKKKGGWVVDCNLEEGSSKVTL